MLAACVLALASAAVQAQITTIDFYRMGEVDPGATVGTGTGTTRDSVGGKHLTLAGVATWSNDLATSAVNSVGSTFSMNLTAAGSRGSGVLLSSATDNFGLEAWVKPSTVSGNHCIAYNGNTGSSGWGLFQVGNTYQALFGGVVFFGSAPVTVNAWTHVAVVRNNGTATLYVNGSAAGTTTSAPNAAAGAFAVGVAPPSLNSDFLSGLVDEVRAFTFAPGTFGASELMWNYAGASVPIVSTLPEGVDTSTSATMNATVNPGRLATTARLEYGTTTSYGSLTPINNYAAVATTFSLSHVLGSLTPNTTYHYRVTASNSLGPSVGADRSFTTLSPGSTVLAHYRLGEFDPGAQPFFFATTTRSSVGSNHLAIQGTPFYISDVPAGAAARAFSTLGLNISASDALASAAPIGSATDNFALEAWIKPDGFTSNQNLVYNGFAGGNGWGIKHNGSAFIATFGGVADFGSAPGALNQWNHVAVVRDNGIATLYLNGVASGSTTLAPNAISSNFFGLREAVFDEVRVFTFPAGRFSTTDLLVPLLHPEIVLEQPVATNLADGGARDFGGLAVGAFADRVFTVRNVGNANLTGLGIAIDGSDASQFSVTVNPVAPVNGPSGATTFTVRFAPTSFGAKLAALHLASNDADETPFDVALTGSGATAPVVTTLPAFVNGPSTATLNGSVNPATLATTAQFDYGTTTALGTLTPVINLAAGANTVPVSSALAGLSAGTTYYYRLKATNSIGTTIGNEISFTTGTGAFTVSGYYRMGEIDPGAAAGVTTSTTLNSVGANHLSVVNSPPYTAGVAAGALQQTGSTLALSFSNAAATASGSLLTNATDNFALEAWVKPTTLTGIQTLAFNGVVGSNGWGLRRVGGAFKANFGGFVDFGFATATFNQWSHVAVVRNNGVATLYLNGIDSGTSTQAPNTPTGGFALLGGAMWDELRVYTFAAGQFSVSDMLIAPVEIVLEQPAGTAFADGAIRDFGGVAVGTTRDLVFTVRNIGGVSLTGLGTSINGTDAGDFTVTSSPSAPVGGPGGSTTFTVRFAPTSTGLKSAVLYLSSNDADENPFDIQLTGTGQGADIQVSKTNFESGLLPGRNTTYTLQVLNAGPSAVGSIRVVDTLPPELSNGQWTCTSQPVALCPNASGAGNIDQTTASIPNGALLQYSLVATPSGSLGAFVANTVTATSLDVTVTELGPPGNNTATDVDPIVGEGIFSNGFEENGSVILRSPILP